MTNEEILRAQCASDPAAAAALDRLLARLAAAEKVCGMVKTSLSPKLRKAAPKKLYWWDVGAAVQEWETLCG
jgi:hypothetical protein